MKTVWLGFLLLSLALVQCIVKGEGETVQMGFFSWGFEASAFTPCGSDERWWTGGADLVQRYNALGVEPYEEVYVRLRGKLSGIGKYGHLGTYNRQFDVTEVLEIRKKREGDCI